MGVKITGTGSYIPSSIEKNENFQQHEFLNTDGSNFKHDNQIIIQKLLKFRRI